MNGQSDVVGNGMKLVGEVVMPGASQILDGQIGRGLLHTLVSGLAMATLGPVGGLVSLAVRLNSFSSSVNSRNLWELASETINRSSAASSSTPPGKIS